MRAFLIMLISVLLSVQSSSAQRQIDIDDKTLDVESIIYDGIDVSSYQKDIDWSTTAQDKNIKFAYVKATEGATYRSRHYEYNIQNARKFGIRVGSYHFFRTTVSVERQFRNFISIVKREDQDLVPLIDVETKKGFTAEQLADSVLAFANLLEDYYGCRPMIYTGSSFYNSYLHGRINGYPLFIARYSKSAPRLSGGAKWILWQFSERGRINGIDHYVDLCRFNKGCGVNDILIKGRRINSNRRNIAKDMRNVPPPRKMEVKAEEKPVPLSKKEQEKQRKAQEKAKKEAEKKAKQEAEKKAKQEAEAKRLRDAQKKKQLQEKERQAERNRQQELEAQRLKEKQKKEELKKQQEQLRKQQEAKEKEAKRQQELQRKAEQEKQRRIEEQKRQELLKKQKKVSANDRNKNQGKRINGSSADNDD